MGVVSEKGRIRKPHNFETFEVNANISSEGFS